MRDIAKDAEEEIDRWASHNSEKRGGRGGGRGKNPRDETKLPLLSFSS